MKVLRVSWLLAVLAVACARNEDITPQIAISPGAAERIRVMDALRHHGDVRRFLPRVTAEELDDAELAALAADAEASGPVGHEADGGQQEGDPP